MAMISSPPLPTWADDEPRQRVSGRSARKMVETSSGSYHKNFRFFFQETSSSLKERTRKLFSIILASALRNLAPI
jgi:hypothetical protein